VFAAVSPEVRVYFVCYKNSLPSFPIAAWRLLEDETGIIRSVLLGSVTNLSVNVNIKTASQKHLLYSSHLLKA